MLNLFFPYKNHVFPYKFHLFPYKLYLFPYKIHLFPYKSIYYFFTRSAPFLDSSARHCSKKSFFVSLPLGSLALVINESKSLYTIITSVTFLGNLYDKRSPWQKSMNMHVQYWKQNGITLEQNHVKKRAKLITFMLCLNFRALFSRIGFEPIC